jgi:hypothetical protein
VLAQAPVNVHVGGEEWWVTASVAVGAALLGSGRIPSVRIGGPDGPLRFVGEDIDRWIDEARAAWSPGRPAVGTRHLSARSKRPRRSRDTDEKRII